MTPRAATHAAPARPRLAAQVLVWLGLGLCLAQGPATAHAAAVDLLGIWQQARSADPVLSEAEARRGLQLERSVQARAPLLPQLQATADDTRGTADGQRSQAVGAQLTQVLFDLGRLRSWEAERTLASAQAARVRAAEQDLAARVVRAYFGLLSAQAALATARTNEAAYAQQATLSQARFEAGLAAQVDVEQSRTYHALAQGGTVLAQQAVASAGAALAEVTGQPAPALRPLARLLPALPPEPADVQAWVDHALQAHPQLEALRLGVAAGERRIAAARAAHAPTVSASLDSQRASGPAVPDATRGRSQTLLAVRLTVPLFAGGATASGVRAAAHEREALEQALEAERRARVREVQTQHQAVWSGVVWLQSTAAAVAAAESALTATRSGLALGTRSNTDLLLAIQTQAQAQRAHDEARHATVLARLLLQHAAGTLGEAELTAANRLLQGEP
ncbi:MAG: TolC family outer membrane protein [Rubrivivax sp.]